MKIPLKLIAFAGLLVAGQALGITIINDSGQEIKGITVYKDPLIRSGAQPATGKYLHLAAQGDEKPDIESRTSRRETMRTITYGINNTADYTIDLQSYSPQDQHLMIITIQPDLSYKIEFAPKKGIVIVNNSDTNVRYSGKHRNRNPQEIGGTGNIGNIPAHETVVLSPSTETFNRSEAYNELSLFSDTPQMKTIDLKPYSAEQQDNLIVVIKPDLTYELINTDQSKPKTEQKTEAAAQETKKETTKQEEQKINISLINSSEKIISIITYKGSKRERGTAVKSKQNLQLTTAGTTLKLGITDPYTKIIEKIDLTKYRDQKQYDLTITITPELKVTIETATSTTSSLDWTVAFDNALQRISKEDREFFESFQQKRESGHVDHNDIEQFQNIILKIEAAMSPAERTVYEEQIRGLTKGLASLTEEELTATLKYII